MVDYALLKTVHILSSTLLFGTGLDTAFHGWMANRSDVLAARRVVNRNVELADWLCTTPAVIVQPVTGVWLARLAGFPLTAPWLMLAIGPYVMVGACWLPVLAIQIRMRRIAEATPDGQDLPARYHRRHRHFLADGGQAGDRVVSHPPFRRLPGAGLNALPPALQRAHDADDRQVWTGTAQITASSNPLARRLCRCRTPLIRADLPTASAVSADWG